MTAPSAPPRRGAPRRRSLALAAVPVTALIGTLALANRHAVAHQIAISVSQQPTRYTELYFAEPNRLPTAAMFPDVGAFRFTIANHEARPTSYTYVVNVESDTGATTMAAKATVEVAGGASVTEPVVYVPPRTASGYAVTVTLAGRVETIRFLAGPAT